MTIKKISQSEPFFTMENGALNHNELVGWHDWFCRVESKGGRDWLVLKSYEGPEMRFEILVEEMTDPETGEPGAGEPFRSAYAVRDAVVCALHNSVRVLVGRALGNRDGDDRGGWKASIDGKYPRHGYEMLDWESK